MSFKIANHAIRMVFANLEDVLKLTLVPYVILTLIGMSLSYVFTGTLNWQGNGFGVQINAGPNATESLDPTALLGILIYIPIYLPLTAWLAGGWHRFVLAEEYPSGFMPRWQRGRIAPYAIRVIQLFFTLIAGVLIMALAIYGLNLLGSAVAVLGGIALGVTLIVIYTRISIVLPAISIDRSEFGIAAAFEATEGASGTILGATLVFFLYLIVVMVVAAGVSLVAPFLTTSFEIILEWVTLVVGISFLTTLYGVIVEGRSLG